MALTSCHMSISLDGFTAGPGQDRDNPSGDGGMALHEWHLGDVTHEADKADQGRLMRTRGGRVRPQDH